MSTEGERFLGIDGDLNKPSHRESRQTVLNNPSSGESYSKKRYPALRIIATIYRILAIILGILGVGALVFGIAEEEMSLILFGLLIATLGVITSLAASEGILVFLDIEENTRRRNISESR